MLRKKNRLLAIALVGTFIMVVGLKLPVANAIDDSYDDVSLYPTFKLVLSGNYTVDESLALQKMSLGDQPIAKTDLGYVFKFNVDLSPNPENDLSILSLDDLDETAIDPHNDAYGHEEINLGSISFIGNPTYKIENETDVDATDGEYFFYDTTTFDSDDYQYLLIEDAATHGSTLGKIVVNVPTTGNITIFNDIISGVSCNDLWFRLDQHCSFATVNNISIESISYGSVNVFGLSTGRQWSDTRYHDVYVGGIDVDDLITGTFIPAAASILTLHKAHYHIDNCNYGTLSTDLTDDNIVACRSPAWEENGIPRVSGWLDEDQLEEDLKAKIAAMENVNINDIDDYAISNAIGFWEQKNDDVLDEFSSIAAEAASKFTDAQSYVNYVAERTMPCNVFLIDVDNDILGSAAVLKNYKPGDGLSTKTFWESIKSAASTVYDTVTAGVASIGRGIGNVAQWGMDLIGGGISAGQQTITGLVDSAGKIANNVVGAVTSEKGALNPMNFFQNIWSKLGWWLIVIIVGAVAIVGFLAWAITRSVRANVSYQR